jgi:hypothetical protein
MAPVICTMTPRNKSPMPQLESVLRATLETRSPSAKISTERPRKLINVGKVILMDSLSEHKMCPAQICSFSSNSAACSEGVVLLKSGKSNKRQAKKPPPVTLCVKARTHRDYLLDWSPYSLLVRAGTVRNGPNPSYSRRSRAGRNQL